MTSGVSSAIRRYNRFELKYLVGWETAASLRRELLAHLQPDRNGDGDGRYFVSSLYYDSPDRRFYWEKVEGLKFRRKLRIRHYEEETCLEPDAGVFVEIKQRMDRVTQKRRVQLHYRDALTLCNERTPPGRRSDDGLVVKEVQDMLWRYNLRPTLHVSYLRQALVGSDYDVGLRVTFDSNVRYRCVDLELDSKKLGPSMISPEIVIMEIKVNERVPYWLTELVAEHNLRLVRVSKYCQGLQAARQVPRSSYYIG
jgi:SPX domain protein involved in polyphosphate accumulation